MTQADPSIRIAECFLSLQGEGPSLGTPAHFVRLQGCSVGCAWCDTKYTWSPEGGESVSLPDLTRRLRTLGKADLLVLTGGEPLENPGFHEVAAHACEHWPRVEVETSGIVAPPRMPPNLHWNWSPKLASVTPKADVTWRQARAFREVGQYICKIVIDSQDDWREACVRVREYGVARDRVFIMPQGLLREDLAERARWLAPRVIEQGFRLTPRFHVDLWGARRGV